MGGLILIVGVVLVRAVGPWIFVHCKLNVSKIKRDGKIWLPAFPTWNTQCGNSKPDRLVWKPKTQLPPRLHLPPGSPKVSCRCRPSTSIGNRERQLATIVEWASLGLSFDGRSSGKGF